ncbi:hypothetical protein, partial [Vibrio parahaemolyticus]
KKASDLPKEKKQNSFILQNKKTEVLLINCISGKYLRSLLSETPLRTQEQLVYKRILATLCVKKQYD